MKNVMLLLFLSRSSCVTLIYMSKDIFILSKKKGHLEVSLFEIFENIIVKMCHCSKSLLVFTAKSPKFWPCGAL